MFVSVDRLRLMSGRVCVSSVWPAGKPGFPMWVRAPPVRHKRVAKEAAADPIARINRAIASLSRNKVTEDSVLGEDAQREKVFRTELGRLGRERDAYVAMATADPKPRELVALAEQWRTVRRRSVTRSCKRCSRSSTCATARSSVTRHGPTAQVA